ncbi:MAG: fumarate hydratase, partial [Clostridia bacterium]|nr:fumarate hydratase [Clostridia bacterium]
MREIGFEEIASALAEACIKACSELPEDVVAALSQAYESEDSPFAKETLRQIIENARMAKEQKRPCCQDTGLAVVFAELGR